ncbi:MAG TPA: thioredoxin family protein [Candidatus Binatia bacterium]|nr:thioredoxin family protein [Candidatus Binatia bacterium]
MKRAITLVVVLVLVIGAISYLESKKAAPAQTSSGPLIADKQAKYPLAPDFADGTWFNTQPLHIKDLRGKVVLVDFWTYSCINCIRTLPYLTMWDEKYRDAGLVIVGVHTPEFDFEKVPDNVQKAIEKYGIKYPVVQDNDYLTWRAYHNQYWPREFLIDADGFVRHDHIGEGGYEQTEMMIQGLLEEKAAREGTPMNLTGTVQPGAQTDFRKILSPELYLGALRRRHAGGNAEGYPVGQTVTYAEPTSREDNIPYNVGTWTNNPDTMELASDTGTILLKYNAKQVNIVASAEPGSTIEAYVDGTQVMNEGDIINGTATIRDERLYTVVDGEYGPHDLELRIAGKGFTIYTFTFG